MIKKLGTFVLVSILLTALPALAVPSSDDIKLHLKIYSGQNLNAMPEVAAAKTRLDNLIAEIDRRPDVRDHFDAMVRRLIPIFELPALANVQALTNEHRLLGALTILTFDGNRVAEILNNDDAEGNTNAIYEILLRWQQRDQPPVIYPYHQNDLAEFEAQRLAALADAEQRDQEAAYNRELQRAQWERNANRCEWTKKGLYCGTLSTLIPLLSLGLATKGAVWIGLTAGSSFLILPAGGALIGRWLWNRRNPPPPPPVVELPPLRRNWLPEEILLSLNGLWQRLRPPVGPDAV